MSSPAKRLAAAFYLSLDTTRRGFPYLLAGASAIQSGSGDTSDCRWAGLNCEARLIHSAFYGILVISFWQSDFLRLLDSNAHTTDPDATSSIAEAFRKACETLHPAFAFIATHLDQATEQWMVGLESSVLNHEANRLATQGLGMIYFDSEMDDHWTPHPTQEDRDSIPVTQGRLMFAGKGPLHWFG
jgi:hypothetical protein